MLRVHGCKIMKIPFDSGQGKRKFSLYIVLTDETDGLPRVVKNMDVDFVEKNLVVEETANVKWMLNPHLEMNSEIDVKETLKSMGLVLPFDDDLARLSNGFYTSGVTYNAVVGAFGFMLETEEKDTSEGIAVTNAHTEDFIVDRPFVYFIKEEVSGIILVVGHVIKPNDEEEDDD